MKTPCWEYNKSNFSSGYGRIHIKRKSVLAHAVSYLIFKGEAIYDIHHKCENSRCINPDHLVDINHVDHCRQSSYASLTKEKVDIIRGSKLAVGHLALMFKVSISTIYKIREGLRWQEN